MRVHFVPFLGTIPLAKLQPHHVRQLVSSRLLLGLSPRTAVYRRVVLRAALNDALKWGVVARNAAELADPPQRGLAERRASSTLQARRFLAAASGDRLEALYAVAVALGLCQGEALGLTCDNGDLDRGLIHVVQQVQWIGGRPQLVPPKSATSRRVLRLPRAALRLPASASRASSRSGSAPAQRGSARSGTSSSRRRTGRRSTRRTCAPGSTACASAPL